MKNRASALTKKLFKQNITAVILILAVHLSCYLGAQFIVRTFRPPLHYVATAFDAYIPLIPLFVIPYWLCYAHWIATYYVIVADRARRNRFSSAMLIGSLTCFFIYIFCPTAVQRPPVSDAGSFAPLFYLLYSMDEPVNALPSMHCFLSWICCVGVRKQESIKKSYRIFTFLCAAIVFSATVFVKQHYIMDILPAVLIAEGAYALASKSAVLVAADRFWARTYRSLKYNM
ncbi:phosphatase PAP2 family protein [Christensenellaceae bacterium OttesenSCG-928-M15]|nr:phosphatase PAP2 family protein [Christensenellaceae bacterium OttesenSCG-928-M15]